MREPFKDTDLLLRRLEEKKAYQMTGLEPMNHVQLSKSESTRQPLKQSRFKWTASKTTLPSAKSTISMSTSESPSSSPWTFARIRSRVPRLVRRFFDTVGIGDIGTIGATSASSSTSSGVDDDATWSKCCDFFGKNLTLSEKSEDFWLGQLLVGLSNNENKLTTVKAEVVQACYRDTLIRIRFRKSCSNNIRRIRQKRR